MLDSVRAALHQVPDIANRVVVVGQSQGGGAAFATAGFAPDYAPDLDIRGTVATGVPYLTPDILRPSPAAVIAATAAGRGDPNTAYELYVALMVQQGDPSLLAQQMLTTRALPVFELARISCVGPLFSDVLAAGLNWANALTVGFRDAFAKVLPAMQYTTFKLRQPLFVGTGEQDHDVPPPEQLALVRNACNAGSIVEAHLYAGLNHSAMVNASLKDSLPFVRKVLAGEPIAPVCAPTPE